MNRAIIIWWPDSNLGDDLLAINFLEKTYFDEYIFYTDHPNPKRSIETVLKNTSKTPVFRKMETLEEDLISNDYCIFIGGSVWSEFTLKQRVRMFEFNDVNFILFGNNFSKCLNEEEYNTNIKAILDNSMLIFLRDTFSTRKSHTDLFMDPIYSMNLDRYIDSCKSVDEKSISITFALPDKVFNFNFSKEELFNEINEMINQIMENNEIRKINLVSFNNEQDIPIINEFKGILEKKLKDHEILVIEYRSISEVICPIYESKFNINTRFHSIVLSKMFENESYDIAYDTKGLSHIEDLNNFKDLKSIKESSQKQFDILNNSIGKDK